MECVTVSAKHITIGITSDVDAFTEYQLPIIRRVIEKLSVSNACHILDICVVLLDGFMRTKFTTAVAHPERLSS